MGQGYRIRISQGTSRQMATVIEGRGGEGRRVYVYVYMYVYVYVLPLCVYIYVVGVRVYIDYTIL